MHESSKASHIKLSVIIIQKNEAANIVDCLESVRFADEWIILDSGSTDASVDVARRWGATVYETDWPGFGPQKNRALEKASGQWVLSIDADERVTPELAAEIMSIVNGVDTLTAYEMPRLSSYCGHFMRHGGWWPDYVLRLFKKESACFSNDLVHEHVVTANRVGRLKNHFVHYSFPDLSSVLRKIDQYSTEGALMLDKKGKKVSLSDAIVRGGWAFFRTYILKLAILDGKYGFMLAVSNAHGTYYRYLKCSLIQLKRRDKE